MSREIPNLALEISIPERRHGSACKDRQKNDDDRIDSNVPEHNPTSDLEASCRENIEVEHDQREFYHAENGDVSRPCDIDYICINH